MSLALMFFGISCGGSSGGGNDEPGGDNALTIEGTLSSASSAAARMLEAGQGGIAGVQVSALGDSVSTDNNGNFALVVDGASFAGGTVEFTFLGQGLDSKVVLEGVLGGAGATAYVNFLVESSGEISGESLDAAGNVLGTTPGAGLGCTTTQSFSDGGGGGALWKPHAERTGTVVILMPAEYRNASVEIYNSSNDIVAEPMIRDCCEHNGGREHIYLTHSAGSLASSGTPITVKFQFPDGTIDCRTVPDPNQRYD
jgi:hypothetical protein